MRGEQQGVVLKLFLSIMVNQLSSSKIVHQTGVEEYVIERGGGSKYDLFVVHYKNGTYCREKRYEVSQWCSERKATIVNKMTNSTSCGCNCGFSHPTFLPHNLACINKEQAESLGGCSSGYIHFKKDFASKEDLLSVAVNLSAGDSKELKLAPPQSRGTCSVISGHYFDYNGFQIGWKSIHDQIFSFNDSANNMKLQWTQDKRGDLSGRIIQLCVVCHDTTSSVPQSPREHCMLFKASGTVTYYAPSKTGSVPAVPTALCFHNPSSFYSSSPSLQLPRSAQISSLPPKPQPTLSPLSSPSLSATTRSPTAHTPSSFYSSSPSLQLLQSAQISSLPPMPQPTWSPLPSPSLSVTTRSPTMHTDRFSTFFSMHIQTSSLQTRPALRSSRPILPPTSEAEMESYSPVNSKEISKQVINTGIPKSSVSTGEPNYSKASELPPTESSLPTRDGPGDKEARKSGNDKGVAIGAGVGGAVAVGIIVIGMIIVFCKRRKSGESTEKKAKLDVGVKNSVYGKPQGDIKIERPREKAKTFSEQESQPTCLELVGKSGHENYGAVYSSLDENYDNSSVYQSLNKNTPAAAPVYQSLQNNQPSTKKAVPKQKLSNAKKPEKPTVQLDPVYSVLEESDTKQGDLSEALYNVLEGPNPGHDTPGNIQDPVYNVLDGLDAGQTYEDPDVGVQQDPLYNVLEVPESKQEHQEPLYNVLESADTENACSRQEAPQDGAISEPLYNVLDGEDSGGANVSGAEYASPNRPLSGRDNPAYEQTLEFGVPNAVVHCPESQRESFYEPLEGSDRQDVYEPLQKRWK